MMFSLQFCPSLHPPKFASIRYLKTRTSLISYYMYISHELLLILLGVHMHMNTHAHEHICTCTHAHAHTHTHARTHTHTHTHTPSSWTKDISRKHLLGLKTILLACCMLKMVSYCQTTFSFYIGTEKRVY